MHVPHASKVTVLFLRPLSLCYREWILCKPTQEFGIDSCSLTAHQSSPELREVTGSGIVHPE